MASAFSHLADLIDRAQKADGAPRQTQRPIASAQDREAEQRDREAYRRQSREDIAFGRKAFLEQQARQAEESDPEAARLAHDKAVALLIVQAGARAKGLPVPTRLVQDEEPSDEYHDERGPGDDRPHPRDKKSKKKAKPKPVDEGDKDSNEDDEDANQGDEDDQGETEAQYQERCRATAHAIIMAGKRRRGEIP